MRLWKWWKENEPNWSPKRYLVVMYGRNAAGDVLLAMAAAFVLDSGFLEGCIFAIDESFN